MKSTEMTEDVSDDGSADLGDDHSLASGIDEINYDDPFSNNRTDGDLTIQDPTINGTNHETLNPIRRPPNFIGAADNCDQHSFCVESCKPPPARQSKSRNATGGSTRNTKDTKSKKQQPSYSILKPEIQPIKARKMSTRNMIKPSKSDGFLTLALKSKYKRSSAQQLRNNTISTSNSGYSLYRNGTIDEMGNGDELTLGKANASWQNTSGSQKYPGRSIPKVKSSSMHDLLRQSKTKCRSQYLLRQSSAHSLSKRNSFQSIKFVNEKLDVSSLLPAKQYSTSTNSSKRWYFPNISSGSTGHKHYAKSRINGNEKSTKPPTNDGIGANTDSLLHEACRLFPNSDTVVETALRVDPSAVRRSVTFIGDKNGGTSKSRNNGMYGYPVNLALYYGASEKIIKLLVQSGSDVLALKDGTNCSSSLGIVLSSKHCNAAKIEILLSSNNRCVKITDRRRNYPLHVAVSYGRSLDIVRRLYDEYPEAQGMRNFHSQTPLDIAIQSTRCPEEVTDFLRSVACHTPCTDDPNIRAKESDLYQSFGSLEEGLDDIMQINY